MTARLLIIIIALSMAWPAHARTSHSVDSLLAVLDATIDATPAIEGAMRKELNHHRNAFDKAETIDEKFHEGYWLFFKYRRFRIDSAMYYANERLKMAAKLHPDSMIAARINKADATKRLGRYSDAINILDSLPRNNYVRNNPYFYDVYHSTLNSLTTNAINDDELARYSELRRAYRDSLQVVNYDEANVKYINQAEKFKNKGNYAEALKVLLECEQKCHDEVQHSAVFWAVLGETYRRLDDNEGAKYGYAMAAIIDKRNCNKTYTSLQILAALLFDEGDTERAYRYITLSMIDVKEARALSRLSLVGEYLPIITTAYEKKQHTIATRRTTFTVVATILVVLLVTLLVLLVRRSRKLALVRQQLADSNGQLQELNSQLNSMNKALEESNIIKELYIGQLFNLCSNYIDQMENYRAGLIAKFKTGRMKDIEKMLNQETANVQLKQLFKNFDMIFLEIFPHYIEDFNKLLRPDERIQPKAGELLSPELRIYALVRLGINDSTKIAEFLHYSTQTVYNYRQKTRNKALMPKEDFIKNVQEL